MKGKRYTEEQVIGVLKGGGGRGEDEGPVPGRIASPKPQLGSTSMKISISSVIVGCLIAIGSSVAAVNKPSPPAADTAIRILFIADERLSAQQTGQALRYLQDAWSGTNFSWPAGTTTTIQIANFGAPIQADKSNFDQPTVVKQLEKVRALAEELVIPTTMTLRDFHGADVVIGLSQPFTNPGIPELAEKLHRTGGLLLWDFLSSRPPQISIVRPHLRTIFVKQMTTMSA